ncbi:hypothetical protein [Caenimonas soli]|nr:hypothetical protein [Caenimonas soli]
MKLIWATLGRRTGVRCSCLLFLSPQLGLRKAVVQVKLRILLAT